MQRLEYTAVNQEQETTKQSPYSEEDLKRYRNYASITVICAGIVAILIIIFETYF